MSDQANTGGELTKMKLSDLKKLCKKHNLSTSGTKVELISRLVENNETFTILQPGDEDKLLGEVDDDAGSFSAPSTTGTTLGTLDKTDDEMQVPSDNQSDLPTSTTVSTGSKRTATVAASKTPSPVQITDIARNGSQVIAGKSEPSAVVCQADRIIARANRFGLSRPTGTLIDDKLTARARRFGLPVSDNGLQSTLRTSASFLPENRTDDEAEKRRKRAERFGMTDMGSVAEAERKARRLERFGTSQPSTVLSDDKLKAARALKFGIQTDEEKLLKRKARFGTV